MYVQTLIDSETYRNDSFSIVYELFFKINNALEHDC